MNLTPAQVLKACGWTIVIIITVGILTASNLAGFALGAITLPTVAPLIHDWMLERRMRRELKTWLDA